MRLVSDPVFANDYLSFPMDGSFSISGKTPTGNSDFPKMPVFVNSINGKQAQSQVFVSEHTLNSALDTLANAGFLSFPTEVSSTYLKTFFSNFEEVYGHHEKIKIILETETAPRIEIKQGISSLDGAATLRFLNPFNDEYEAVMMRCNLTAEVEFELLHDFTLVGDIKNMTLSVTAFEAYFQTSVTLPHINTQVESLAGPFAQVVNYELASGYRLPIPARQSRELSQTRLFTYDHFLMVESDPQITTRVRAKALKMTNHIEQKINNFFLEN